MSKQPPPYPTSFDTQASFTHPLLGQSLGYPAVLAKMESPLLFWTLDWPCAGLCPAPGKNLVATYIYRSGFHTRCLYRVFRRSIPRSHYSPSPPMKLMMTQSLPPSSASSVMIMSHHIDLACLGHRKNYLTLHCFLTENSSQSDKISSP